MKIKQQLMLKLQTFIREKVEETVEYDIKPHEKIDVHNRLTLKILH